MITRGLSCDRVEFGHFGGGQMTPLTPPGYGTGGEGIDPKHFVSLLYISVAIKASLLKFSMFSVHKNTMSNIFLVFSNFKIVGLVQIGILIFLQ